MKPMKIVTSLVALFITLPIWFYLIYKILEAVNASELMWFLFWIYLPASIFLRVVSDVLSKDKE